MSLIDRVAIVTGAGSGIGQATARAFAGVGADLVLVGRRSEPLEETAEWARTLGPRVLVVPTDITVESEVQALVTRAVEEFGRVDVLVNAAASAADETSTANMTLEVWNETLATTLTSVMLLSRECLLQSMLSRGAGSIVNIASTASLSGVPDKGHFSAAKAGVLRLTESLAHEVGPQGVRANAIIPGLIATERLRQYHDRMSAQRGVDYDRIVQEASGHLALRRLIRPEEVAAVAVFLAGDESSGVTGQAISVTGG